MLRKLGKIRIFGQDVDADDKVPPGQFATEKFPVLTFGATPTIDINEWHFRISGLVREEKILDWGQFMDLPSSKIEAPFHCVTQWSKLENFWEGVSFEEIFKLTEQMPEATHIMVHCYGGYSTNLSLDMLKQDEILFAYIHDGNVLTREHGYPLRLVVPSRYGWKSAKWVSGVEYMAQDRPGFWESRGYHMRGDYWSEERFWDDISD